MPPIVKPAEREPDAGVTAAAGSMQQGTAGSGGASFAAGGSPNQAEGGHAEGGQAGAQDGGAEGGQAGAEDVGGEGGQAGAEDPGPTLPAACPGKYSDYNSVIVGEATGETFDEEQLDGRVLVLGGSGDDLFFPSPPGAGDCLLGGAGNDRFETNYLSAPSVFVGGEGDDLFVLRGSADTDTAYISDFKSAGNDRIVLDAMAYGLTFVAGPPLPTEVVSAPGFAGGNSNAGEVARILYDPESGGLWFDSDAEGTAATAVQIAVIQNFANYSFDLNDFALE